MRTLLKLTMILIFCFKMSAQDKVKILKDSLPLFEGVINVPNKTDTEIYSLLKEWVVRNYNSPGNVIQMDNPEFSKLIVKGLFTYNLTTMGISFPNKAFYTIKFETKDGRFKYSIEYSEVTTGTADEKILSLVILSDPPLKSNGKSYNGMILKNVIKQKKEHINYLFDFKNKLISSFEKQMINEEKNSNW